MKVLTVNTSADALALLYKRIYEFISDNDISPVYFYTDSHWIRNSPLMKHNFSYLITQYTENYINQHQLFKPYSGLRDLSNHNHDLHNIVKIYKFLRNPPTEYRIPIVVSKIDIEKSLWRTHPGASRLALLEYIDVLKIPIIMIDGYDSINNLPNLNKINSLEVIRELYSKIDADSVCLRFEKNRFELSEDHRVTSEFVNDKAYLVAVLHDKILINNLICFEKNDGKWLPILENIRK